VKHIINSITLIITFLYKIDFHISCLFVPQIKIILGDIKNSS